MGAVQCRVTLSTLEKLSVPVGVYLLAARQNECRNKFSELLPE
jgi:hypothetical protein